MKIAIITDQHFGCRKNSKLFHDYFLKFYDDSVTFCMPDPSSLTDLNPIDCDPKPSSGNASAKYVICVVKYDRSGEVIRNAKGDPTIFCNKHDSQISAMFDLAMSSVEKQQHQSTMQPVDDKS